MVRPISLRMPRIIEFGRGKIKSLVEHVEEEARVYILVDPSLKERITAELEELQDSDKEVMFSDDIVPEPPFDDVRRVVSAAREFRPDVIVGIGGGSAMDLAKVVSVLISGEQDIPEIVGIENVKKRYTKLITIPTTAGTGSEVTPIAVLTDVENKLKKGVVSNHLVSDVAIVDPDLTATAPASVTAATGMDAMTHCIEAFTNQLAHPLIDNYALEGIRLISGNLKRAVDDGNDMEAREALSLGSFYGGLCLGPVNTAAVHALAYPLGGEFKVSHGVSNSVLLPFVMQYNLSASPTKYAQIGEALGAEGDSTEGKAYEGLLKVRKLSEECGIPSSLQELKIPEEAIPMMAKSAMKVSRLLNNNPAEITEKDAVDIYTNAYLGKIN